MDDPDSWSDEEPAGGLIGELDSMCSIPEAQLRMETRQVDKFEISSDGSKFVKKYQRSSADKKYLPNEIRTESACWNSIEYLLSNVLDFDTNPKPGFSEQCHSAKFFDIYSFLRDRLRAIRVDLHVQNNLTSPIFIQVHEYCLRFELVSIFRLWGKATETEKKFDIHLTLTALSQTIDPLTNAYSARRKMYADKGETVPDSLVEIEAEITEYILLLSLTSRSSKQFKTHYLKQPVEIQTKIGKTYWLCCDYFSGRYGRFLAQFESLEFLSMCAVVPVLAISRTALLWRMVRTNRPFFMRRDPTGVAITPAPRPEKIDTILLAKKFALSPSSLCEFFTFHGLITDDSACYLPPRQLTRNPIQWWFGTTEWINSTHDERAAQNIFTWDPRLVEQFQTKIGEDAGDDRVPERTELGQHPEPYLETTFAKSGKSMKQIVVGQKFMEETTKRNSPKSIRISVPPLAPPAAPPVFSPPVFTLKPPSPKPVRPAIPIEPLQVLPKRPRESNTPPTSARRKQKEEPIPPALVEIPEIAPPVVYSPPELPDMPSGFDFLANALAGISISQDDGEAETKSPVGSLEVSTHARLVMDEIAEGIQHMREVSISQQRRKFVALKCLAAWRDEVAEMRRWRSLAGTKKVPIRL
jgi:hypothetical protein